jgi:hypothetical protein
VRRLLGAGPTPAHAESATLASNIAQKTLVHAHFIGAGGFFAIIMEEIPYRKPITTPARSILTQ